MPTVYKPNDGRASRIGSNEEGGSAGFPAPAIAWWSLFALSLAYMFSLMDRYILTLLVDPIKATLQISDTQVSLLTGVSFAIIYTVMGVPLGRLADSWSRKYVIITGVTLWSLMTMAGGLTRSFGQLFVTRMGVGLGEAGLTAPAYALIADLFPQRRLAFAMSVFVMGGLIGAALSNILGGTVIGFAEELGVIQLPLVGDILPWQLVLLVSGSLSLLVVVPLALMPNTQPRDSRKPAQPIKQQGKLPPASIAETEVLPFRSVLGYLLDRRIFFLPLTLAYSVNSIAQFGVSAWIATFLIRVEGWSASEVGITLGLVGVAPMIIGTLISGRLADYLYSQGYQDITLRIQLATCPLLFVSTLSFIYFSGTPVKLLALGIINFVASIYMALTPTVMQMVAPAPMRAQVSALLLLVMNLIGLGLGPVVVALITDYGFADEMAVGHSLAIVATVAYLLTFVGLLMALRSFVLQINQVVAGEQTSMRASVPEGQSQTIGQSG